MTYATFTDYFLVIEAFRLGLDPMEPAHQRRVDTEVHRRGFVGVAELAALIRIDKEQSHAR